MKLICTQLSLLVSLRFFSFLCSEKSLQLQIIYTFIYMSFIMVLLPYLRSKSPWNLF